MRILIIEDNRNLVHGLRHNLELEGHLVDAAFTGAAGLERARSRDVHLILLDLMIPRPDGFQVLRTLREEGIETPVIVLTARGEEADKVRGLRLGADDYVTKPFGLLELLARVDAVRRRLRLAARPVDAGPICFGDVVVDPATRTVHRAGAPVALRPKEFDLLLALAKARGNVVSRDDLLEEVWRYDPEVVSRTLDTHVGQLRQKLEPRAGRTLLYPHGAEERVSIAARCGERAGAETGRQRARRLSIPGGCAARSGMQFRDAALIARKAATLESRVRWPDDDRGRRDGRREGAAVGDP